MSVLGQQQIVWPVSRERQLWRRIADVENYRKALVSRAANGQERTFLLASKFNATFNASEHSCLHDSVPKPCDRQHDPLRNDR